MTKKFNPAPYLPLPEQIGVVHQHGERWSKKAANWWAGTTIASPTNTVAAPAKQCVNAIRAYLAQGVDALNDYFAEESEYARHWVRKILQLEESAPVLLDASGTAAILTASRICAWVAASHGADRFFAITTDEGGSLVPAALRGLDPNEMERTMFQPWTGLFYQAQPVMPYPAGMAVAPQIVRLTSLDNDAFVNDLRRRFEELYQAGERFGCLLLPTVIKSGRILPVAAVSELVLEFRQRGMTVFLIVDDIQGIGRREAECTSGLLDWCDAYVIGSSKALGGLLIASAVVVQPELLERFLSFAASGGLQGVPACIPHFQFPAQYEERLPDELLKNSTISMPEVCAMSAALFAHFERGNGDTYAQRRRSQLAKVESNRARLVAALNAVPGVTVLESQPGRPLVPSIVSLKLPGNLAPAQVKELMQEGKPIVTPGAPIGRYLRLDIPEYREMPSIPVLIDALQKAIGQALSASARS